MSVELKGYPVSKATSGAGASARERVYAFRTLLLLDCRSLCLYGSIRF